MKCGFKSGLFYIISLLLFEAQRMLTNVSAAQKLILGNVLVGKQEDKKRKEKKSCQILSRATSLKREGTNSGICKDSVKQL